MSHWDFDSVYKSYSRMVYWTAYGYTASEADAMDVSQETFLRAIKNMNKLEALSEPQLKSWLYRVAVNLCMDSKRRAKHEVIEDELPENAVDSSYELPELSALMAEQRSEVKAAIDSLPEIYRRTVILHFFSGLQYEQIAQYEGVSEGTIKSRMFRAKARLYDALKGGAANE